MTKKVLIIEDTEDLSSALKILIEMEGFAAIIALSGSEGRDKAVAERPDLILMNISLPDTDGVQLTREFRSLPETAGTPSSACPPSREGSRRNCATPGAAACSARPRSSTTTPRL